MALALLKRIETRSEGLVTMAFVAYLNTLVERQPSALTPAERVRAFKQCSRVLGAEQECPALSGAQPNNSSKPTPLRGAA